MVAKKTENIETALMVLDNERITEALTVPTAMDVLEAEIRKKADEFEGSLTTAKSRKAIASFAYEFSRTKTASDGFGKEYLAGVKAKVKMIDGARKKLRDTFDECRDSVRKPLTDWENERKAAVESLKKITKCGDEPGDTIEDITKTLARLQNLDINAYPEDMHEEVREACDEAQIRVAKALAVAEKTAEDAKELDRLRQVEKDAEDEKEKKRIADEAVEKARVQADASVQREADEALRKQREAELKAENAQREADEKASALVVEAQRKAAQAEADAEASRLRAENAEKEAAAQVQREKDAEAAATAKREADEILVRGVMFGVYNDLMQIDGMKPTLAEAVTRAIHAGSIANVSISI